MNRNRRTIIFTLRQLLIFMTGRKLKAVIIAHGIELKKDLAWASPANLRIKFGSEKNDPGTKNNHQKHINQRFTRAAQFPVRVNTLLLD